MEMKTVAGTRLSRNQQQQITGGSNGVQVCCNVAGGQNCQAHTTGAACNGVIEYRTGDQFETPWNI